MRNPGEGVSEMGKTCVTLGTCKGCLSPGKEEFIAGATGKGQLNRYLVATGQILPGTAGTRDFSKFYSEVIRVYGEKCIACMKCTFICPDTALHPYVLTKKEFETQLARVKGKELQAFIRSHVGGPAATKRYARFAKDEELVFLLVPNLKHCKACGLCPDVCPTNALEVRDKADMTKELGTESWLHYKELWEFAEQLPETDRKFITTPLDTMLDKEARLAFTGGAGNCWGCGETPVIRTVLGETIRLYGKDSMVIVAATGCNTVYGSMYPWNPFNVAWYNSLFENACEEGMGLRLGFDQQGLNSKKIWVVGGDGAMYDIGFGGLSRLLTSNLDVKVLVLDSQVYSNTGGQASSATPFEAAAKMAPAGNVIPGKVERRKELALIAMMHPEVFVAQVTPANMPHLQKAVKAALEYPGPAVINAFTPCIPEWSIPKDATARISQLAVDSRSFPLFIHDPRKGKTFAERLSLEGNPSPAADWHEKDGKRITPEDFAKAQGRFKHLFKRSDEKAVIERMNDERLLFWRQLQDLAGVKREETQQKEEVKAEQPAS